MTKQTFVWALKPVIRIFAKTAINQEPILEAVRQCSQNILYLKVSLTILFYAFQIWWKNFLSKFPPAASSRHFCCALWGWCWLMPFQEIAWNVCKKKTKKKAKNKKKLLPYHLGTVVIRKSIKFDYINKIRTRQQNQGVLYPTKLAAEWEARSCLRALYLL